MPQPIQPLLTPPLRLVPPPPPPSVLEKREQEGVKVFKSELAKERFAPVENQDLTKAAHNDQQNKTESSLSSQDVSGAKKPVLHSQITRRRAARIGWIMAAMGVLLVLSLMAISGLISVPFYNGFTHKPTPNVLTGKVPCPPENVDSLPLKEVKANVYNATSRTGLAGETAKKLGETGLVVGKVDNWGRMQKGSAQIFTAPKNLRAAYSLQKIIPDSVVILDEDLTDQAVDLVLGDAFATLASSDVLNKAKEGKMPFASVKGCFKVN